MIQDQRHRERERERQMLARRIHRDDNSFKLAVESELSIRYDYKFKRVSKNGYINVTERDIFTN